jgi:hypothetical protein
VPRFTAPSLSPKNGASLPHVVMIANGRLSEADYYRALAHARGMPSRAEIGPHELTAPGSFTRPRQCLAHGIMKERGAGRRLCLRAGEVATERLDAGAWRACSATHFSCCTARTEESGLRPFRAGLGDVGLGRLSSLPDAEYAVPSGHLLATPFSPSEIHEMLHVMQPQRR